MFCLPYNINTILFKTGELTSVTYFACSTKDCSADEESDLPNTPQIPEVTGMTSLAYGPHRKLSRGEDINKFEHELEMVNAKANLSVPLHCCSMYFKLVVKHLVV